MRDLGQAFVQWRQWAGWECAAVSRSARRALSGPGPERDTAVQALKAAAAALIAWALAGWWWEAPMAMLAPWTALFLVQSTVYRSLKTALQQFVVVVVGTLLATGAGALTGNTMFAMLIALPVTTLFGSYARFGTQGLNAPTAALFVLVYGTYSGFDILHRFLETLLGAAIGLTVNALVLPPCTPAACAICVDVCRTRARRCSTRSRTDSTTVTWRRTTRKPGTTARGVSPTA